jgi:hypothetical protein
VGFSTRQTMGGAGPQGCSKFRPTGHGSVGRAGPGQGGVFYPPLMPQSEWAAASPLLSLPDGRCCLCNSGNPLLW